MNRHIKLKHPDQMSKNFEVSTYSDSEGKEEDSKGAEEEGTEEASEGTEEEGTEEEEEEEDITEEDREALEAGSNKYFRKRKRRSDEDESEDESDVSSSDEEDRCDVRWGPKSAKAHKKCFKRIGQALNKYTINILKY